MGSFRGGKRGGSRTAHLKAPAAEVAAEAATTAAPAAAPKPSPWRTTRSWQPASRQAPPAKSTCQNRGNLSVDPIDEAEPIEEEDEEGINSEATGVRTEGDVMEQDDEDEDVSDMEAEEEEDQPMAGAMHAEGSGELVFVVVVGDALAGIPTSQPERWEFPTLSQPPPPPNHIPPLGLVLRLHERCFTLCSSHCAVHLHLHLRFCSGILQPQTCMSRCAVLCCAEPVVFIAGKLCVIGKPASC